MKRVIVTGATSMLGGALIKECIANGVEVVAIARNGSDKSGRIPSHELVKVVQCDLDKLKELNISGVADVFYHFAWAGTSKENRDDPRIHLKNVEYTLDAIELAHRCGCKMFVGAGSQAEYGICTGKIYSDTCVQPVTSYGIAKYTAGKLGEKLCQKFGMKCVWTRIFSVYGEHDGENTMIKYALRQFASGQPAQFSAATQMWNYLYEGDAGKIFYLLGEKDVSEGVYNVASEDTRPLKDFIIELKEVYGKEAVCQFAPPSNQPAVSLDPDISSLTQAIGWRPDTPFRQGITKTLNYFKIM